MFLVRMFAGFNMWSLVGFLGKLILAVILIGIAFILIVGVIVLVYAVVAATIGTVKQARHDKDNEMNKGDAE